jgi:hypothetical protein
MAVPGLRFKTINTNACARALPAKPHGRRPQSRRPLWKCSAVECGMCRPCSRSQRGAHACRRAWALAWGRRPARQRARLSSAAACARRTSAAPGAQGPVLLLVEAGAGDARASGAPAELNGGASALEAAPALRKGDVFFLPAHTALRLAAGAGGALTLWTAAVNARVFDERFRLPARAAPAEAAAAPAEAAGAPAVAVA